MLFFKTSSRLLGLLGVLITVMLVLVDPLWGLGFGFVFAFGMAGLRPHQQSEQHDLLQGQQQSLWAGQPDRRRDTRRPGSVQRAIPQAIHHN